MDTIEFSKDLIKGKIAETVFEQMFRASGKFTILRFGYEYTLPEIAQYHHLPEVQAVLKNIRNAPDFVLISQDRKEVYLVEVKYRGHRIAQEIKTIAEDRHRAKAARLAQKSPFETQQTNEDQLLSGSN